MPQIHIIKKLKQSIIAFKMLPLFLIFMTVFILVAFNSQIINRITPEYRVILQNQSGFDLSDIKILTSEGDFVSSFNLDKDAEEEYRIPKNRLLPNSSYNITVELKEEVYTSLFVSFSEKYKFRNLIINISTKKEGEIIFRVFGKNV